MIVAYHEVLPGVSRYIYSATPEELRNHIHVLLRRPALHPHGITFDDGHVSQYHYALPVLDQLRVKAIFFITSGWVATRAGYINWGQLREMAARGHEIGAHGHTHVPLSRCAPDVLHNELHRARATLADRLGCAIRSISMPGGDWNQAVLDACRNEGFERVYTSDCYRPVRRDGDFSVIGRAMVRRGMTPARFERLLASESVVWSGERLRFALKRTAKRVIGPDRYRAVWRRLGQSGERVQGGVRPHAYSASDQ